MYRVCGYGGLVNDVKVDKGIVGGALSMVVLVGHGKECEVGMHIVGLINEVDMGHVVDVLRCGCGK